MKKIIILSICVMLFTVITCVYYISIYSDVSNNILRLHVIANSNSEKDVATKLHIRDKVLEGVRKKVNYNSTKQDVLSILSDLEINANRYLEENNIEYGAKIFLQNTDIPRKEYNGIILPKGRYLAMKVVLGDGKGDNWWCVAYPPLCFTESVNGEISEEGREILKNNIDYNSYKLITSDIKYELKIAELVEKIFNIFK